MTDDFAATATPALAPASAAPADPATGGGAQERPSGGDWPDDWRARLADGDGRLERRLERFAEPRTVLDSLLAAEQRLRGGDDGPAPDGDPNALAAWRAASGVPDTPDAYQVELPDGAVLGETDQPLVDGFLASAHAANMSNAQVNQALAWYYRQHDEMAAAQAEQDRAAHDLALQDLQASWGGEFGARVNRLHAALDGAPEGLKENLLGARMADGSLLGDCAPVLMWLEQLAASAMPAGALTPAGAGGAGQALANEIASIESRMASDRTGYFKDEKMQARYRELLAARAGRGR